MNPIISTPKKIVVNGTEKFRLLLGFCLILLVSFTSPLQAKPLESKAKIDQASDLFMTQIVKGDVEAAYSMISAYLGVNFEQFNARAEKVVNDMAQLEKSIGKPLSYDILRKQAVKDHFYKISYLLKYESAALIWELNYYQPELGWHLVDVSFNADINALFGYDDY